MKNDDRKLMRFQRILIVSNGIIITVGYYRELTKKQVAFLFYLRQNIFNGVCHCPAYTHHT